MSTDSEVGKHLESFTLERDVTALVDELFVFTGRRFAFAFSVIWIQKYNSSVVSD